MEYMNRTWEDDGKSDYIGYGPNYLAKISEDGWILVGMAAHKDKIIYTFIREGSGKNRY